jgi:hypothetical protein
MVHKPNLIIGSTDILLNTELDIVGDMNIFRW